MGLTAYSPQKNLIFQGVKIDWNCERNQLNSKSVYVMVIAKTEPNSSLQD
jgi:hypothetical protein